MAKRKNTKKEEEKLKNSTGETSLLRIILMIAPILGIALGVFYVTKKDNLFSDEKGKIEISKEEFNKAVLEIISMVEGERKIKKELSQKDRIEIIEKKFVELKGKSEIQKPSEKEKLPPTKHSRQ